ncbi:uncharacterized protein V6R79_018391 [Siganus canaliculatus]
MSRDPRWVVTSTADPQDQETTTPGDVFVFSSEQTPVDWNLKRRRFLPTVSAPPLSVDSEGRGEDEGAAASSTLEAPRSKLEMKTALTQNGRRRSCTVAALAAAFCFLRSLTRGVCCSLLLDAARSRGSAEDLLLFSCLRFILTVCFLRSAASSRTLERPVSRTWP